MKVYSIVRNSERSGSSNLDVWSLKDIEKRITVIIQSSKWMQMTKNVQFCDGTITIIFCLTDFGWSVKEEIDVKLSFEIYVTSKNLE